jgi:Outer membrane protein SusF_SusE
LPLLVIPSRVTTVKEEGALTVSGVVTDVTKPVAALTPLGKYKLILTVVDKNNNTKKDTTTFEVLSSVAIIGSATPGGWNTETAMTRSAADPDVYTATLTLVAGEAKFRANNDWAVAWGDTKFPLGTGSTAGGAPNIPVVAGRYLITLNISSGAYSFVAAAP